MTPEPLALPVEVDHEQVGLLQLGQDPRRPHSVEGRVAERPREQVQRGGANQEVSLLGLQGREHLGGEVVEYVAVVAADADRGVGRMGAGPQRQAGQLEPSGPALGLLPGLDRR